MKTSTALIVGGVVLAALYLWKRSQTVPLTVAPAVVGSSPAPLQPVNTGVGSATGSGTALGQSLSQLIVASNAVKGSATPPGFGSVAPVFGSGAAGALIRASQAVT